MRTQELPSEISESKFFSFLKDNDLMGQWRNYRKPRLKTYGMAKGWSEEPDRPVHELKQVLQKAIDSSRLVGGSGLMDIDFEVQNKEDVSRGTKVTMELKGVARAGNRTQVQRLLDDLQTKAGKALSEHGFWLKIDLSSLYVTENKKEELDFMVMATAILTNRS